MPSLQAIREELQASWDQSDPAIAFCNSILMELDNLPPAQVRMLSLASLKRMAGADEIDDTLIRALNLLTAGRHPALVRHFVFIDDDGSEYVLAPGEYEAATSCGWMEHPRTGEQDTRFRDRVFLFFDLSPGVLGGARG